MQNIDVKKFKFYALIDYSSFCKGSRDRLSCRINYYVAKDLVSNKIGIVIPFVKPIPNHRIPSIEAINKELHDIFFNKSKGLYIRAAKYISVKSFYSS